uniref:Uncharacterized protein n=1 Tax=Brassica napus TaxID=3708 RepID=I7CDF4_BRANA|nr:hypothetical protein [Brassica napus]
MEKSSRTFHELLQRKIQIVLDVEV